MSVSVFIASPCLDGRTFSFHTASVATEVAHLGGYGIRSEYVPLVNFPVLDRARNLYVKHFLTTKHSHLLFWDSDCSVSEGSLGSLLLDEKAVVGGIGTKKKEVTGLLDDFNGYHADPNPVGRLLRMQYISTQFLLIHRSLFSVLASKGVYDDWFKISHPSTGPTWTEDFAFSALVRKHGFEVWGDLGVQVIHYGVKAYLGDYGQALFRHRQTGLIPEQTPPISGELSARPSNQADPATGL